MKAVAMAATEAMVVEDAPVVMVAVACKVAQVAGEVVPSAALECTQQ